MDRRPRVDWEAIFHGSERKISTVIIGNEAVFRSRKRMSREEAAKRIRRLKGFVNLSYDSEAAIARARLRLDLRDRGVNSQDR